MPSNLQIQLDTKAQLFMEAASAMGELTPEQEIQIAELDVTLPIKVDAWAYFIKEDLPNQIQNFKDKIKEYQDGIKKLESFKQYKELYLNKLIHEFGELKGSEKKIKADDSITSTIDLTKIDPKEGRYVLSAELSYDQYQQFKSLIDGDLDNEFDTKRKCLVSHLASNHPAIIKEIRPTIKIVKA